MDNVKMLSSIQNTVDELKGIYQAGKGELAEYKSAIEKLNQRLDDNEFNSKKSFAPSSKNELSEERTNFLKAFHTFGKKNIHAAKEQFGNLQVKTRSQKAADMVRFDLDSAGALLTPAEVDSEIVRNIVENTPILQHVRTKTMGAAEFKVRVRKATGGAYLLGESDTGAKVKNQYSFKTLTKVKMAAGYGYSLELDEDVDASMENEIITSWAEDSAELLGSLAINGSASGKFQGMVGNVTSFDSAATSLTGDMLINLFYAIKSGYRTNAKIFGNRLSWREVRKLALSGNFQYIWEQSFQMGEPSRLLGAPIVESPDLAQPNAAGVYAEGAKPFIYGDFQKGYTIGIGNESYVLRDQYTQSAEYEVVMRMMKRYAGAVILPEALVELNITTS